MKTCCLYETLIFYVLSGPLHPVEQPALLEDLPQVVLVEQILQETNLKLHRYLVINSSTWKGSMLVTMMSSSTPMFWMHQLNAIMWNVQLFYLRSEPWQACVDDVFQQSHIGHPMVQGEVDHKPLHSDTSYSSLGKKFPHYCNKYNPEHQEQTH